MMRQRSQSDTQRLSSHSSACTLLGVEPKWLDVEGINTRYFECGSGETIFFITGGHFGNPLSTSIVETWAGNFSPLASRYHVVAVDKVGQGYSDNPLNDDYTIHAVVRHLEAFIRLRGLAGLHLVGQSAGAVPVIALARECPELIRSCTIVNTSSLSPGVGTTEVALAGCPHPRFTRESQRWVLERSSYRFDTVTDELVEAGFQVMQLPKHRASVEALDGRRLKGSLFAPSMRTLKRDLLQWIADGGLGRPTQVIWGYNDKTAAVDRGVELYHMIAARQRHASLQIINEAGHHPFREHPEQFNEMLHGFIRSQSLTSE
jgi:2-hydroxy-6-oxo-6-(2'-carboxyphenyl)-hexa-2,4-dienoate hydrolase